MSLKLVHSVKKPEVETAESREPGIDQHQNDLAAVDRVRQHLITYSKELDATKNKVELQLLMVLVLSCLGYEEGLIEVETKRRARFFNKRGKE